MVCSAHVTRICFLGLNLFFFYFAHKNSFIIHFYSVLFSPAISSYLSSCPTHFPQIHRPVLNFLSLPNKPWIRPSTMRTSIPPSTSDLSCYTVDILGTCPMSRLPGSYIHHRSIVHYGTRMLHYDGQKSCGSSHRCTTALAPQSNQLSPAWLHQAARARSTCQHQHPHHRQACYPRPSPLLSARSFVAVLGI